MKSRQIGPSACAYYHFTPHFCAVFDASAKTVGSRSIAENGRIFQTNKTALDFPSYQNIPLPVPMTHDYPVFLPPIQLEHGTLSGLQNSPSSTPAISIESPASCLFASGSNQKSNNILNLKTGLSSYNNSFYHREPLCLTTCPVTKSKSSSQPLSV